jgi:L-alanine-DL-glutamate epimerase-like enolase superfamily enzyme
VKVTKIKVHPLAVYWDDLFGGRQNVPPYLLRPSANFTAEDRPRLGQLSTLVVIETDEGVTGIGESWGLPDPQVATTLINRLLAPCILGQNPLAIEHLWESMVDRVLNGFHRAFLMEAISGIDIALWDIKGKILNLPVHQILGGPFRQRIKTYASPVPFMPPDAAAEKAREFVAKGFQAMKIKVGADQQRDIAVVAAVRDAVGANIMLVADANCGCTVPEAIQLGRRLTDYGVAWLEEPLPVQDRSGLARVREALDIAVVAGENEHTARGVLELLQHAAVDAVQINITRVGGITGALRIAHLAHAYGIPIAPHGVGSAIGLAATLQYLASIPNFMIYEYNQLLNPLRDNLLAEPFGFEDGALLVPQEAGLGVTLAPNVLAKYALKQENS